ncbi:putative Lysophospholipase L1 and related esterases [Verrucomicrobia bacterium]|nr:putative Lysophospholipase L1 and related esterases [Verrucomicrobiota bacterium]
MKSWIRRLLLSSFVVAVQVTSALAADFLIRDGDRVVFLGNSITEQRLYTTYIEAYALTRHPDWKLSFRNVGWGGDTSWLRQRAHPDEKELFAADEASQQRMVEKSVGLGLERDVLPLKPTLVTVKFGMNDHAYQAFREDIFRAYVRSQTQTAKVLEAKGARVAFLTPQPIEDKRPDPDKDVRNQSLRQFCDGLREVAVKTEATFVDQFDPYMAILVRERAGNPPGFVGGGDAVHPGPIGHTVMAWAVLKGLGAPAKVSNVEIDVTAQKVVAAEGCHVEHLQQSGGETSFDRLDEALPMPIDERAEPALKLAPIMEELNRLELHVTGLAPGNYNVSIDGELAGKVTAEELAEGWNLADAGGPITKQAREVLKLVFEKNNVFFRRWRDVQLFSFPAWAQGPDIEAKRAAELAHLDRQISEMEAQIDTARKPKSHHFVLKVAAE